MSTQQTAKPMPATPEPDLLGVGEIEGAHARHNATPSRCAKEPGPRSSWIQRLRSPPDQPGRKRRGPSFATAGPPRKQPLVTMLNAGCRGKYVFGSSRANYSALVSDRCDSGQNKTHTFSKREQKSFSAYHKRSALMQSICTFCLSTRAEAWQAIPGVSAGVMTTVRQGYTLQFAQRPPRFPVCSPPQCASRMPKSSAQR